MNIFNNLSSKKPRFTHLLIDLILIFILSPFASNNIGYLILSGAFFLVNLLVIKALPLPKFWINLLKIIALLSFVLDIIYQNPLIINSDSLYLYLSANIIDSSFILLAILLIGDQILMYAKVQDTVFLKGYKAIIMPTLATSNIAADYDPTQDQTVINGKMVDSHAGWFLTPLWNLLN
jgi:hypothetical protein